MKREYKKSKKNYCLAITNFPSFISRIRSCRLFSSFFDVTGEGSYTGDLVGTTEGVHRWHQNKDGKSVRKWRYLKKNYETSETTDIIPHVKNQLLDYGVGNETCSLNSSVVSEDSEKDIKENLDVL